MKNLDDLLTEHAPKPKRPLSINFTESVQEGMKQEKQSLWQTMADGLHVSWLSRTGAAALVVGVFIGGSVAAFSLWPRPSVSPTITTTTPSGNRIVGFSTENCLYFQALDGSKTEFKSENLYYEVHKNSKLTDAQIQAALQGVCEENVSNNAVSALVKKLPQNLPGMQSTVAYTITAISDQSISVSLDPHYDAKLYTLKPNTTYTNFAKDLQVYNQDLLAKYKDLAVGDTIKMVVQDTSGKSSEASDNYNALNHPETITILGIIKIPALTGDPSGLYSAVGTDIVRLEPCSDSATGFCRVYDFAR